MSLPRKKSPVLVGCRRALGHTVCFMRRCTRLKTLHRAWIFCARIAFSSLLELGWRAAVAVMIRMRAWFRELVPSCTAGSGREAGYSRCFWRIGKEALARRQEAGREFSSQRCESPSSGGQRSRPGAVDDPGLDRCCPSCPLPKKR